MSSIDKIERRNLCGGDGSGGGASVVSVSVGCSAAEISLGNIVSPGGP